MNAIIVYSSVLSPLLCFGFIPYHYTLVHLSHHKPCKTWMWMACYFISLPVQQN